MNMSIKRARVHLVHRFFLQIQVDIALYTGNVGIVEETVYACTVRMHHVLNSLNIIHYFDDYGHGKSMGSGCAGDHDMSCWTPALIDVVPRIMAVLEQQP